MRVLAHAVAYGSMLLSLAAVSGSASAQTRPSPMELVYTPINSCRAFDTRATTRLPANQSRNFYMTGMSGFPSQGGTSGGCGVPPGASAVTMTLTALNGPQAGYLKAYPTGSETPTGVVMNYAATVVTTVGTNVALSAAGQLAIFTNRNVDVAGDITGYFVPQIAGEVSSAGALNWGTTRILAVEHPSTGLYYVTVDRDVRSCSVTANAYNIYRYASTGLTSSTTPNKFSVYIWTLNSTTHVEAVTDYDFFFKVSC